MARHLFLALLLGQECLAIVHAGWGMSAQRPSDTLPAYNGLLGAVKQYMCSVPLGAVWYIYAFLPTLDTAVLAYLHSMALGTQKGVEGGGGAALVTAMAIARVAPVPVANEQAFHGGFESTAAQWAEAKQVFLANFLHHATTQTKEYGHERGFTYRASHEELKDLMGFAEHKDATTLALYHARLRETAFSKYRQTLAAAIDLPGPALLVPGGCESWSLYYLGQSFPGEFAQEQQQNKLADLEAAMGVALSNVATTAVYNGRPWAPTAPQRAAAVHTLLLLRYVKTSRCRGKDYGHAPRVCWAAATGYGKGHIIATIALLWSQLYGAEPDLEPTQCDVTVLCCDATLAVRDDADFHPINTLSLHKIRYVSDFAALLAITRGLIMIDEIDYVTHRKFDIFQQWMQDSKAHSDLHIVVLSAHPCPTASDNEISWFEKLEHCGFFRMNLVDEPGALPKGLPENSVPLDLSTHVLIDALFDRLRRSGPVVVHIMADHDYWQMF